MTRDELVAVIDAALDERLCVEQPAPHPEIVDVCRDLTGNVVLVRQSGLPTWAVLVVEVSDLHVIKGAPEEEQGDDVA